LKVSKEQAATNRERILTEAAKMFRERGFEAASVDALADAAGFTHGSLYSQFGSKDRLAAEALAYALDASATKLAKHDDLEGYVEEYLSPDHRGRRANGCALAALGSEMPRQDARLRAAFTDGVKAMVDRLQKLLPEGERRNDEALAMTATLVGALILSRSVSDKGLSDRILTASRESVERMAGRRTRERRK
jgi:TetR/AcrR family transcriptional regulator, transcriptional repressor for nem operon